MSYQALLEVPSETGHGREAYCVAITMSVERVVAGRLGVGSYERGDLRAGHECELDGAPREVAPVSLFT